MPDGASGFGGWTVAQTVLGLAFVLLAAVVTALVSRAKNWGPHPLFWFFLGPAIWLLHELTRPSVRWLPSGYVAASVVLLLICCLPDRSRAPDVKEHMARRFRERRR